MTQRKIEYWAEKITQPPEADAEFAAHRELVLDTYETPYDMKVPVLCMEASLAADR